MTTTTTFKGMEPGAKSSSRVLRPPGGGSNISFGTDGDKPPARVNKMASSVFAEPEDPYANRRNNPPGGEPTGVLCGESSAPRRRRGDTTDTQEPANEEKTIGDNENGADGDVGSVQPAEASAAEDSSAGLPSGRRNPPGGKSSLILG